MTHRAVLRGTRVLVTGATGFIGSHLTRRLVADGAEVHAMTSTASLRFPERLTDVRDRIFLHVADMTRVAEIENVVTAVGPHLVFHCAGLSHTGAPWRRIDELVRVNVLGTVNLLEAIRRKGVRRLVFLGSGEVYGHGPIPMRECDAVQPKSPYAISKYSSELVVTGLASAAHLPVVLLRAFTIYGPAQPADRFVAETVINCLEGRPVELTDGYQSRDFVYVDDVVDGIVSAATLSGIDGEIINLGTGVDHSVRNVASTIVEICGRPVPLRFGAATHRPHEAPVSRADPAKARRLLGWSPAHTLVDGLTETVDWYRELRARQPDFAMAAS